jgi:hypothetical protein
MQTNEKTNEINEKEKVEELPDAWWHRVYLAVIITTIIMIMLLGLFSETFSSYHFQNRGSLGFYHSGSLAPKRGNGS